MKQFKSMGIKSLDGSEIWDNISLLPASTAFKMGTKHQHVLLSTNMIRSDWPARGVVSSFPAEVDLHQSGETPKC